MDRFGKKKLFGLLLWALTYVGSWFSGLCILLLVVLGIFSIPKFYETYQEPIDRNLGVAKEQVNNITNTMHEKLPFLKKVTGCAHEKTN
ncbi:Reticulon-1 [Toxocara canis]|uniref:Reticulon-like protein n=1 Tax=Toxocara canis TaxID=6265 RepID=A0A0B2VQH4_TOXCA|nr:Reticulon-1 [Toxocara canis]